MTSYTLEKHFPHASPDSCYQICQEVIVQKEFSIWKSRPLAWFFVAHRNEEDSKIEATIGCRPGGQVILTLKGDQTAEKELAALAHDLMQSIEELIVSLSGGLE